MEPRTLYALIAAALLVPFGTAVAQEATDAASPAHEETTYKISIMPAEKWAAPGATATYRVVVESRANTTVALAVRAPDLVAATLSSEELVVAPGAPAGAELTVVSRENTSAAKLPIVIVAKSTSGETHEARAVLILRERPDPRPCAARDAQPNSTTGANACARSRPLAPAHGPDPEPRPYAADRPYDRADELEKSLELLILRAERYLAKLEGADHARPVKPAPIDRPEPRPIVDVKLRLSDENVTLGNEGRPVAAAGSEANVDPGAPRGRVAILIENGPSEGRLPLKLRYDLDTTSSDAAAGWKVELEKDAVVLRPHERTYVWILFRPDGAGSVRYGVSAGDSGQWVQGTATFPGPSIA